MFKTRLQTGDFFKYRKQIEELVQATQSDLLTVSNTLNKKNETEQYVNIFNSNINLLVKKYIKKYLMKIN